MMTPTLNWQVLASDANSGCKSFAPLDCVVAATGFLRPCSSSPKGPCDARPTAISHGRFSCCWLHAGMETPSGVVDQCGANSRCHIGLEGYDAQRYTDTDVNSVPCTVVYCARSLGAFEWTADALSPAHGPSRTLRGLYHDDNCLCSDPLRHAFIYLVQSGCMLTILAAGC